MHQHVNYIVSCVKHVKISRVIATYTLYVLSVILLTFTMLRGENISNQKKNLVTTQEILSNAKQISDDITKPIKIKQGYFWDSNINRYWYPLGIAYQTWNKALGQWQTEEELIKNLDAIKELGANSIRADFVWGHIEVKDQEFDFERYDFLLEECQKRNIRVFPLIGYQWPPKWYNPDWLSVNPISGPKQKERKSHIMSYENPAGRKQAQDFIYEITKRYSLSGEKSNLAGTVAGWILGNEYGYLGLWSVKYDGYDQSSKNAFQEWLKKKYKSIDRLNQAWAGDNQKATKILTAYPYQNFSQAEMPPPYVEDTNHKYPTRDLASWYDLSQWREYSIALYIADLVKAARKGSPEHLVTYSSVGMQWGEEDNRYHSEDLKVIAEVCEKEGAPLDFISLNNYPWAEDNNELISGHWGIRRAKDFTNLPVMISETGFSNSETMYPITIKQQASHIKSAITEAVLAGSIGLHVFHWHNRTEHSLSEREREFGLVKADLSPKPSYYSVKDTFRKIKQIGLFDKVRESIPANRNIAILWNNAVDTIHNRYVVEMKAIYGSLRRLGYRPKFVFNETLYEEEFVKKYNLLVLPRNQKLDTNILIRIKKLLDQGLKLYANNDLPGLLLPNGNLSEKNTWLALMIEIFNVDPSYYFENYQKKNSSLELIARRWKDDVQIFPEFSKDILKIKPWKYLDKIKNSGGQVIAYFDQEKQKPTTIINQSTYPGQVALNLFSFGFKIDYSTRDVMLREIVGNQLGLIPAVIKDNPLFLCDLIEDKEFLYCRNISTVKQTSKILLNDININSAKAIMQSHDDTEYRIHNGILQLTLPDQQFVMFE